MLVTIPVDYIMGYLRYGHFEGNVNMTKEEFERFNYLNNKGVKNMSKEEQYEFDEFAEIILDSCELLVDDWRIEDYGDICWNEINFEGEPNG